MEIFSLNLIIILNILNKQMPYLFVWIHLPYNQIFYKI